VGTTAWRFADVADYWDELVIRSFIVEGGATVLYQEGASHRCARRSIVAGYVKGAALLPPRTGMVCGTVGAIGGIRRRHRSRWALRSRGTGRSRIVTTSVLLIAWCSARACL
jgi:hypothetical protein